MAGRGFDWRAPRPEAVPFTPLATVPRLPEEQLSEEFWTCVCSTYAGQDLEHDRALRLGWLGQLDPTTLRFPQVEPGQLVETGQLDPTTLHFPQVETGQLDPTTLHFPQVETWQLDPATWGQASPSGHRSHDSRYEDDVLRGQHVSPNTAKAIMSKEATKHRGRLLAWFGEQMGP
ncbi:unnamed protein product [Effrenium voratum]|nr:unnamed protein product [Effrenium voratum]